MSTLPQDAQKVDVNGATTDFFTYEKDGVVFYQFDSSKCSHPEPMINAMAGLQHIKGGENLVMINHKAPAGLFPKIEDEYSYVVEELEDGRFKMTFSRKTDASATTDYSDNSCSGGGACS